MDYKEKKWFEVSGDELESRMVRHQIMHNEPISKAVSMVYHALDKVLESLGVVVENGHVEEQQELLGIYIIPLDDRMPENVRGMVVSRPVDGVQKEYAWVSAAHVKKSGEIHCKVELYDKNILWEFNCGVNILNVE